MQQGRQKRVSDDEFNAIFARNHGSEEREYYSWEPQGPVNVWEAYVDRLVNRGPRRRTGAARGCE